MDFGELLHTAKKNDQGKPQIQYYSTKFAPPKKEQRTKTLSVNVQKFLAKKEAEERRKREEDNEKRTKLLALRSQDKRATRRVNVMLKRTKSANQSVIADAVDCDNTSVTLAGPSQPDEDDYGYVSQESSALYNKMMEKYSKMPEEPKFPTERKKVSTNLSSTKDRVKAALEKEKEEALLPHRRKRKHADSGGDNEKGSEKYEDAEPEREPEKKEVKPKFKAAPLVNFSDLLKLAEKKQFEPVVIETKKEEEERPLTKKQKKEMEREREWRERKESQNKGPQEKPPGLNRIPKLNGSTSQVTQKIPRKNEQPESKKVPSSRLPEPQNCKVLDKNANVARNDRAVNKPPRPDGHSDRRQSSAKPIERNPEMAKKVSNNPKNLVNRPNEKGSVKPDNLMPPPKLIPQQKRPQQIAKSDGILQRELQQKKNLAADGRMKQPLPNSIKRKQPPPATDPKPQKLSPSDLKPKPFPPADVRSKQFPPSDLRPKQFPPPDVRRSFPPKDVKRKPLVNKRRILDDDDEDYDSEMDDFIDDDEEGQDYSKYISEIFGYDKRKYRFDDDDVDDMETSFAQQMKEEVISTKIGIMEDLEELRQEEAHKKEKLLMKKRGKL